MFRNTFYLASIMTVAMFAGCRQDNPTLINSTLQTRNGENKMPHNAGNHGEANQHEMNQNSANHNAANQTEMNHSEMKSAPNAANQAYDLQFLDTMIAHHEAAAEMAKPATVKARSSDLKTLAFKIVADQEREIAQMKGLREQWFAGQTAALNMEMTGMNGSMEKMNMTKLIKTSGDVFDVEFINQMTPHHEGAITMAREALTKAEHPEIKQLANQIIKAQEAEVKAMQTVKTQYGK